MHNIEKLQYKKMVVAEHGGFSFEANSFKSVMMIISCFVPINNIETFQNQDMVVAENVGFRFEADFFKSVQIIIGFGCHGQHGDASQ